MIVLEGPDNAGKSTLADYLCKRFDLPKYTAGPAPKTQYEMIQCYLRQSELSSTACVHDRVTCISQSVYSGPSRLADAELDLMIDTPGCVFVYCRPPERVLMDFSNHRIKSYDTEESLSKIMDNQHEFIKRYDSLFAKIPHVQYDWTECDTASEMVSNKVFPCLYDVVAWEKLRLKWYLI
jgi:hypothetical protein